MHSSGQHLAVIGSGIAGLASAYFLSRQHQVTLFEANDYLGGHSHTVDIEIDGGRYAVDTGFLVLNQRTYPNLIALLDELQVETFTTKMSFSVSMDNGRFEWAGSNLDTLFAQRRNMFSARFWRMLQDILRFNRRAQDYLISSAQQPETLGQLLRRENYSQAFIYEYLLPMAAAIWSCCSDTVLDFSANSFIRFCHNHGLLQIANRPAWMTIAGGSRCYVNKMAAQLSDVRLSCPVSRVERNPHDVVITTAQGQQRFDQVIFATHAPDTLALLAEPSSLEQQILSAIAYQANKVYLHHDIALLPQRPKVWSAWNYLGRTDAKQQRSVCVSYWLNCLQNLPLSQPVLVTLNPFNPPAKNKRFAEFTYQHPLLDQHAVAAQQRLSAIQGQHRSWFAGAWTGYGFHEDGLKSALRIAQAFNLAPLWTKIE